MPCPYGIDIPTVFQFYNKMGNAGDMAAVGDANYHESRRRFLIGYDRELPGMRQADHCIGCGQCAKLCPQHIDIPTQMQVVDRYVEELKLNP